MVKQEPVEDLHKHRQVNLEQNQILLDAQHHCYPTHTIGGWLICHYDNWYKWIDIYSSKVWNIMFLIPRTFSLRKSIQQDHNIANRVNFLPFGWWVYLRVHILPRYSPCLSNFLLHLWTIWTWKSPPFKTGSPTYINTAHNTLHLAYRQHINSPNSLPLNTYPHSLCYSQDWSS